MTGQYRVVLIRSGKETMMRRALTALVLACLALGVPAGRARAQSITAPDQIQEDWQLVIGIPDPVGAGPQLSTTMSPVTDGSTPCFVFDMNYRDSPTFSPGGMQVQVWSGDTMLTSSTRGTEQCSTTGETI